MPSLFTAVPIVPIAEMDFGTVVLVQPKIIITTMSKEGVIHLLKRVEILNRIASVIMIGEPFASKLQTFSYVASWHLNHQSSVTENDNGKV